MRYCSRFIALLLAAFLAVPPNVLLSDSRLICRHSPQESQFSSEALAAPLISAKQRLQSKLSAPFISLGRFYQQLKPPRPGRRDRFRNGQEDDIVDAFLKYHPGAD